MDVDSFACFDVIIWCDFFKNKSDNSIFDAIAITEKRYLLRHSNIIIAYKNWIFSKYDILQSLFL